MINIKIKESSIELFKFKVISYNGISYITTQKEKKSAKKEGGIRIVPEVEIRDIEIGNIFITQICKRHELIIHILNKDFPFVFKSNGKFYNDTHNDIDRHYHTFLVRNNEIDDLRDSTNKRLIFYDAPYMELGVNWTEINYAIDFETWFQYNTELSPSNDNNIKLVLSFQWSLACAAKKYNGEWQVLNSTCSSKDEILNSIVKYGDSHPPLSPKESDYPRLYSAINSVIPY